MGEAHQPTRHGGRPQLVIIVGAMLAKDLQQLAVERESLDLVMRSRRRLNAHARSQVLGNAAVEIPLRLPRDAARQVAVLRDVDVAGCRAHTQPSGAFELLGGDDHAILSYCG